MPSRLRPQAGPPLVSLSAVSAAGPGAALDGLVTRSTATIVVSSSAGVSGGSVALQGSLDGSAWFSMGSAISTTTASTVFAPVQVSQLVRYVRANIATAITGGTVTASVGVYG